MDIISKQIKPLFEDRLQEVQKYLDSIPPDKLLTGGIDSYTKQVVDKFHVSIPKLNRDKVKLEVKTVELPGDEIHPRPSTYTVQRTYSTEISTFNVPISSSTFGLTELLPYKFGFTVLSYEDNHVKFSSMYCAELHTGMNSDSSKQTGKAICDHIEKWLEEAQGEADRFNEWLLKDASRALNIKFDQAQSDSNKGGTISL